MIGAVLDFGKFYESAGKRQRLVAGIYLLKAIFGLAVAGANFLTALTASAPLVARITGGRSVVFIGKIGAGIAGATSRATALTTGKASSWRAANVIGREAVEAAAREAGIVVTARGGLLVVGRLVLILASWEVAVALVVMQLLIAYFSDNELQTWFEKCAFGKEQDSPPWAMDKQHEEFEKALAAVGLKSGEDAQ